MTQSKVILALAAAVSLGIVQPTNTPNVHEVPLSTSDIVIAEGDQTNSAQGSAKMGEASDPGGAAGQSSQSDTMTAPAPDSK